MKRFEFARECVAARPLSPSSAKSSLHFPDKQGNYEAETGSLMTASTAS